MDETGYSPEVQTLLQLQDTQKEIGSTIMAQIIEVQVLLRTMIDLQKLTITSSQQSDPTELEARCRAQIDKHRRECFEDLKRGVSIAKVMLEDDKGPTM